MAEAGKHPWHRYLMVIGGSHAHLLNQELKKNITESNFSTIEVTRPGYSLERLIKEEILTLDQISKLKSIDTVLVHGFGNSLFPRKNVQVSKVRHKPGKVFHLIKAEFQMEKIESELELAKEFFKDCKAKVYFLDNFLRHLHCCEYHPWRRTVNYQRAVNQKIKTILGSVYRILTHQQLLFLRRKETRNPYLLSLRTRDKVHLKSTNYRIMAVLILQKICNDKEDFKNFVLDWMKVAQ